MTYRLTNEQIAAIREDWSAISTNVGLEKCGIEMIRFIFELHPDYKVFYANFSNKNLDDICRKPYMKIVAGKYMTQIGMLVEHLESPDYVIMLLENLGHFHAKMGVPQEAVYTAGIIMQYQFRQKLVSLEMPPEHCSAWDKMMDILTTFLMTGYENSSPTSNEMRQMTEQAEEAPTSRLNLDAADQKTIKQSLFRILRRWRPDVMASKLAKLMMSRMEIECQARCPMVMPLEKEVIYASKLWLHRLKDDVDRMTTGKSTYAGFMKRAHQAMHAKVGPEDVIRIDRVILDLLKHGDENWNRSVEEAWTHFFAERQRILVPLLKECFEKE